MFIFSSAVVSPPYLIYMGRDKHENEELIRWGWPEDVWFHVDALRYRDGAHRGCSECTRDSSWHRCFVNGLNES